MGQFKILIVNPPIIKEAAQVRVCVGGTFDPLHKGHKALLAKAFEVGDHVAIGLTSDELCNAMRRTCDSAVHISSFAVRKRRLVRYLKAQKFKSKFEIVAITSRYGTATEDPSLDAIVVSPETRAWAEAINRIRADKRLTPLKIFEVGFVLAEDCTPIKGSKIRAGEMTVDGKLTRRLIVCVGTENNIKLKATRNVFSKIYDTVVVKKVRVNSAVPRQPFGKYIVRGAINRARAAIQQPYNVDFGVGIEAGLVWNREIRDYFDVQYCAIIDKCGKITVGHGSGFVYPPEILAAVREGDEVGSAMEKLTKIGNIGKRIGAIGYLSKRILTRTELTEQAVLMALIPRLHWDLYKLNWKTVCK